MGELRLRDFEYDLPEDLIAQSPAAKRDESRLLVAHRGMGTIDHATFSDLPNYLLPTDLLVVNNSRVIPARLRGRRQGSGGAVEILLVRQTNGSEWCALVRPSARLPVGARVVFSSGDVELVAELGERTIGGQRLVKFEGGGVSEKLSALGETPLPPYIRHSLADPGRYQTVYAEVDGSVAAPTAGLHFSAAVLDALRRKGVAVAQVTLHVGPGTFRPVVSDDVSQHRLDHEQYEVSRETLGEVLACRRRGGRIVAVGTTSARVLETLAMEGVMWALDASEGPRLAGRRGSTGLFILPGHVFKVVDALITNLHPPRSTPLMLVSAFAGMELRLRAYAEAVRERYRFYSLGDSMLVVSP